MPSENAPPTRGPTFGAKPTAIPEKPMAVPWRLGGKFSMAKVMPTGITIPVAIAWKMRPTKNSQKFQVK